MNSNSGEHMKKSLPKVISMSAAIILVSSLTACGGDSDSSRNRNSALDPVACLDASKSSLAPENILKVPTCASATEWALVAVDGSEGQRTQISNGAIELPLIGGTTRTIKTFDASGNVVGIDKVKPNGSRDGIIYRIDTNGEQPVYFEVALPGWSGQADDPRVTQPNIPATIQAFNEQSTPAADWILGNEWEMRHILIDPNLTNAIGVTPNGDYNYYWTSGSRADWPFYLVEIPSTSRQGYVATFASDTSEEFQIRPLRAFTTGTESVASVVASFVPTAAPAESSTSTSEAPTSTTEAPLAPPTTLASPEEVIVTQVLDPISEAVNVPSGEQSIDITPETIRGFFPNINSDETTSMEVSFDGKNWIAVSAAKNTKLVIPASAKVVKTRVTNADNKELVLEKAIVREGESEPSPSSSTSTIAPTSANEIPDEGTSASTSSDDESSSNTIWVILGAVIVVAAAGTAAQLRRKKKK
jgi:hypothetical protein